MLSVVLLVMETAITVFYTLSLHDALPISTVAPGSRTPLQRKPARACVGPLAVAPGSRTPRSEEHTSELQSLTNLVCRLLLEITKARAERDEYTVFSTSRAFRTSFVKTSFV